MILGAVLAGGRSTRFGSDKALACLDGQSLLARAIASLRAQCDGVVVVGRDDAPVQTIPDWPAPGMGPLAGVAAALRYGAEHGFDAVLTLPVDAVGLDDDLTTLLAPAPCCVASQPVIGLWPVAAADIACAILSVPGRHSMRALAQACNARAISLATPPANINTPADLAALHEREHAHGL